MCWNLVKSNLGLAATLTWLADLSLTSFLMGLGLMSGLFVESFLVSISFIISILIGMEMGLGIGLGSWIGGRMIDAVYPILAMSLVSAPNPSIFVVVSVFIIFKIMIPGTDGS